MQKCPNTSLCGRVDRSSGSSPIDTPVAYKHVRVKLSAGRCATDSTEWTVASQSQMSRRPRSRTSLATTKWRNHVVRQFPVPEKMCWSRSKAIEMEAELLAGPLCPTPFSSAPIPVWHKSYRVGHTRVHHSSSINAGATQTLLE